MTDECAVQVAVRVRDLLPQERLSGYVSCIEVQRDRVVVGGKRGFGFDIAFAPTCSQASVYETAVKPLMQTCSQGINVTVVAYGVAHLIKTCCPMLHVPGETSLTKAQVKLVLGRRIRWARQVLPFSLKNSRALHQGWLQISLRRPTVVALCLLLYLAWRFMERSCMISWLTSRTASYKSGNILAARSPSQAFERSKCQTRNTFWMCWAQVNLVIFTPVQW